MHSDDHVLALLADQFSRDEWARALAMVVGRQSAAVLAIAFTGTSSGEQSVGIAMPERPDPRFVSRVLASLALLSSTARQRVVRAMRSAPASRQVVAGYSAYSRVFAQKDWEYWVKRAEAGDLP